MKFSIRWVLSVAKSILVFVFLVFYQETSFAQNSRLVTEIKVENAKQLIAASRSSPLGQIFSVFDIQKLTNFARPNKSATVKSLGVELSPNPQFSKLMKLVENAAFNFSLFKVEDRWVFTFTIVNQEIVTAKSRLQKAFEILSKDLDVAYRHSQVKNEHSQLHEFSWDKEFKQIWMVAIADEASLTFTNANTAQAAAKLRSGVKSDRRQISATKRSRGFVSLGPPSISWFLNVQEILPHLGWFVKYYFKKAGFQDLIAMGGNIVFDRQDLGMAAQTNFVWASPDRKVSAMMNLSGQVVVDEMILPQGVSVGAQLALNKEEFFRGYNDYLQATHGNSLIDYCKSFDSKFELPMPSLELFKKGYSNEVQYYSKVFFDNDSLTNAHCRAFVVKLDDEELIDSFLRQYVESWNEIYLRKKHDGTDYYCWRGFDRSYRFEFIIPLFEYYNGKTDNIVTNYTKLTFGLVGGNLVYADNERFFLEVVDCLSKRLDSAKSEFAFNRAVRRAKGLTPDGVGLSVLYYCPEPEVNLFYRQLNSANFRKTLKNKLILSGDDFGQVLKKPVPFETYRRNLSKEGSPWVSSLVQTGTGFTLSTVMLKESGVSVDVDKQPKKIGLRK